MSLQTKGLLLWTTCFAEGVRATTGDNNQKGAACHESPRTPAVGIADTDLREHRLSNGSPA